MNLDRSFFSPEPARSFQSANLAMINGAWSSLLPNNPAADGASNAENAIVPQSSKALTLSSHGTHTSASLGAVSPPIDANRLIRGFRTGDRKFDAGNEILGIGSTTGSLFNLLDGWIAVYSLLPDGRRQIVHFALPGAVLGLLSSGHMPSNVGAQALTDVVVSVVPMSVLKSRLREDPEIGLRLAQSVARERDLAFDHLTSIGRRSARERVAHLLLELFTRYRAQWPGNRIEEMALPLTQEQIGDATGLTFVHVNRVLSSLRKEGIVQFQYRRLRILNPDKLIEVAGVDVEIAKAWLDQNSSRSDDRRRTT
ncbi:Crp/Fnr family transcriptional regulator [Agrobacterium pusense]|uniref:Crp/Fnr family transcriptional regulator n=2 Tax=Agrobacterium pusense TaxID=648995 RepID=UPI0032DA3130